MRHLVVALLLTALFAGVTLPASAADWPRFLGPNANGVSPETGINKNWNEQPPTLLWKVDLTDDGYAGPAVANGVVFIVDHLGKDDILRALDLKTGREYGRYTYADAASSNYGFSRATPLITGNRLYYISRLGRAICLDAKSGKLVWERDLIADFKGRRPGWDFAMSPIIDDGKLIVSPGGPNAGVAALNPETGATIWAGGGSDVPGYATPVVATINGKKQYVTFTTAALMAVDPANGARLWSFPWKTGADVNAATPIVIGNSVFITTNYGHGSALVDITPNGPQARWANPQIQSRFTTPIYLGGYLYTTTEANQLLCIVPATGEVKWRQQGFEWGGLCAVDGTLIVCDGRSGDVVMVAASPDGYRELGRIKPLGGQSWTAPIVADGKLLVRNKKALACLALK